MGLFKEWLALQENSSRTTSGKQSLYPAAYTLAQFYPPGAVINWSADAITYMPPEWQSLKFIWGKGMLSDPSKEK